MAAIWSLAGWSSQGSGSPHVDGRSVPVESVDPSSVEPPVESPGEPLDAAPVLVAPSETVDVVSVPSAAGGSSEPHASVANIADIATITGGAVQTALSDVAPTTPRTGRA